MLYLAGKIKDYTSGGVSFRIFFYFTFCVEKELN
jgi:hypothetical protein